LLHPRGRYPRDRHYEVPTPRARCAIPRADKCPVQWVHLSNSNTARILSNLWQLGSAAEPVLQWLA